MDYPVFLTEGEYQVIDIPQVADIKTIRSTCENGILEIVKASYNDQVWRNETILVMYTARSVINQRRVFDIRKFTLKCPLDFTSHLGFASICQVYPRVLLACAYRLLLGLI